MQNEKEEMRFWATVSIAAGRIREVTWAKGQEMATTQLTSDYSAQLKALYQVKPVIVTVDEGGIDQHHFDSENALREPYAWEVRQNGRTFLVSAQDFTRSSYDSGSFKPLFDK